MEKRECRTWKRITAMVILLSLVVLTVPIRAFASPILRLGSVGDSVVTLQTYLKEAGFDPGIADGVFGAKTDAAVRNFQRAQGLVVDGVVGPITWGALEKVHANAVSGAASVQSSTQTQNSSSGISGTTVNVSALPVLKWCSMGENVVLLQDWLKAAGFNPGPSDGVFGYATQRAVMQFQAAKGLVVDGVCGPKTWAALASTVPAPVSNSTANSGAGSTSGSTQNPGSTSGQTATQDPQGGQSQQSAQGQQTQNTSSGQQTQNPQGQQTQDPQTQNGSGQQTTESQPTADQTSMPVLSLGSQGQAVVTMQIYLKQLGFDPGVADGMFGPKTLDALKRFQLSQGLWDDGICGPKTWAALKRSIEVSRDGASTLRGKVVCIDPGHGGAEPGAISPWQDKEKDFTLAIALKTKAYLETMGATVVMTRDGDYMPGSNQNPPVDDLESRVALAASKQAHVFVSIHINAYPENSSVSGAMVFHRVDSIESRDLALHVGSRISSATGWRLIDVQPGPYYVLNHTYMPAVLVEAGFMTNQSDVTKLRSQSFQETVARSVAQGIADFLLGR